MAKTCTSSFLSAKPKVIIPLRVVRTVSEHYVWCLFQGKPPINISMMNSSTTLASRSEGILWSKINQEGNYSCNATNEVGSESKTFYVSLIGEILLSLLPFECRFCWLPRFPFVYTYDLFSHVRITEDFVWLILGVKTCETHR